MHWVNKNKIEINNRDKVADIFIIIFKIMILFFAVTTLFPGNALCEERLSIKVKLANVRSSPNVNGEVLWKIEKYYPMIVVEKKDGWIKFKDFENDVAWIHASLVDNTESVITIKDKCNVRKGPGQNNPVAFTVERGVPFKVLERKNEWVKIEHADGEVGWVSKTLLW